MRHPSSLYDVHTHTAAGSVGWMECRWISERSGCSAGVRGWCAVVTYNSQSMALRLTKEEQVLPPTPHLVCRASLGSVVHPIPLGGLRPCLFSRIISSRLHNHAYSAPTVFHTRVRWEYSFTQVKAVLKHLASLKAHNSLDRFWYARRSNLLEWF